MTAVEQGRLLQRRLSREWPQQRLTSVHYGGFMSQSVEQ